MEAMAKKEIAEEGEEEEVKQDSQVMGKDGRKKKIQKAFGWIEDGCLWIGEQR